MSPLRTLLDRLLRWILLLCCCFALPVAIAAVGAAVPDFGVSEISSIEYRLEAAGVPSVPAAQLGDWVAARAWQPLAERSAGSNFGFESRTVWLRAHTPARAAAVERVLVVDYPPLDEVQVWLMQAGQVVQTLRSGDRMAFAERTSAHRTHVFRLTMPAGPGSSILVRTRSGGVVAAPLVLWVPPQFERNSTDFYVLFALYFGVVLALFFYNLLLGLQLKEVRFIYYVAFVACLGLAHAGLTGMGMQYLWPNGTTWQSLCAALMIALAVWFALAFTRSFFHTPRTMPRLDVLMRWLMLAAAASAALVLFTPLWVSSATNTIIALLGIALLLSAAWVAFRDELDGARPYGLAWVILMFGAGVLVLHNTALIPSNALTSNALIISSAMEMVLLSLALGENIRNTRADKDAALEFIQEERRLVEDLTQAQARNQELLAERDAILGGAPVGMALEVAGQHAWVNAKLAQMLGQSEQALIGQSPALLHAHADERAAFADTWRAAVAAGGTALGQDTQLKRADGSTFWAHVSGAPLKRGDADSASVWTYLDLTALRQSQDALEAAVDEQRRLTDLRARFVAMTSHELRTPLANILSTQELLKHYAARLSEAEKAELLDQIGQAVQRLARMADRVLVHSRLDAGRIGLKLQEVNLDTLVRELLDEILALHPDSQVSFSSELEGNLSAVHCDPQLLQHILSNLLSNAFKYGALGPAEQPAVVLKLSRESLGTSGPADRSGAAERLRIEVGDNGVGIAPDEVAHLYEPFRRGGNVGELAGSGLGLSIVKQCVEAHGGRIYVSTAIDQGTTFTVHIPLSAQGHGAD